MSVPEEVFSRTKGGKEPPSSKLLGSRIKMWWLVMITPIENFLIEQKVHPNVLTVTSLIVSAITGFFFHIGWIFLAGIFLLAGSTFDVFDGRVARAQGLNSQYGAFFDSCMDRFAEAFIYLGLLGYFSGSSFLYVVFLILVSTMMVSYTRARAEGLGIDCNVGIMQRTERIVYIGVFSVFNFVGNLISSALGFKPDDYLLKFALIVVLAFSLYTSIERMVYVMRKLREKEFKK
ncbi:CDP-diacylglycerol--inositol 3-phosphatidyltransferase [bacterium HR37]|nr:CDP-diacylglycerol--inositol 3-phosphatidyltransferase [bacterium HR37]